MGFSDAEWGGDLDDHKSTSQSGYVFQIGGTAISWRSKKPAGVALSTAEAGYIALGSTAQESVWLQQLLADLQKEPVKQMIIFEDNQPSISMTKKICSSTVELSILLSSTISSENKFKMERWN